MIDNFSSYYYRDRKVYRTIDGSEVSISKNSKSNGQVKLKDDDGKWKAISMSKIMSATTDRLALPTTARPIKHSNDTTFIDTDGSIYTYGRSTPQGIKQVPQVGTMGYLNVNIYYKKKRRPVDIHKLVAETFIMEDYASFGLCCLHADDDKTNCHITNLTVGTYSKNNTDSYRTGRNKGNIHGINKKPTIL